MSKEIDDTFRDLRAEKISNEITDLLNSLLADVEGEREFLDLVGVMAQSVGASLGTLDQEEADTPSGPEVFHDFLLANIDAGFNARKEYYDRTGK